MAIASPPTVVRDDPNRIILLRNVPWMVYQSLVEDPANRRVRMTYDRGSLQLMSPSSMHERFNALFRRMVEALSEELAIPTLCAGSTTFKRQDLERGLEPDACFYIANEPRVRSLREIDLTIDPPPDLAIEIDITSSSLGRLEIYAALGVPEIWRFDGESLQVYELQPDKTYRPCSSSPTYPLLPPTELVRFAHQSGEMDQLTWIRTFRAWVKAEVAPHFPPPDEGAGPG